MVAQDWEALANDLLALKKPVFVACLGGHGRTGTALAILLDLWGAIPSDEDPVRFVRTAYCPEAVETQGQYEYVAKMTGRTLTYEPVKRSQPVVPYTGAGPLPTQNRHCVTAGW